MVNISSKKITIETNKQLRLETTKDMDCFQIGVEQSNRKM